jgi:ribosomal protein L31
VKPDIHPKYYQAKVHCGSCGTEWTVGSTREELRVDVCSNCHPFFTGTQNIIDTAGQVEALPEALGAPGPKLTAARPSPRQRSTADLRVRRSDFRSMGRSRNTR